MFQIVVHLLTRAWPLTDKVDVTDIGSNAAQAVRQFVKICLKVEPAKLVGLWQLVEMVSIKRC